jgi:hypothetical protein
MNVLRCMVLVLSVSPLGHVAWATDDLYKCADGTFTNRVERQCQPYESSGIVRVQGASAEGAKSTVNAEEDNKPPFADVKLFLESVEHRGEDSRR